MNVDLSSGYVFRTTTKAGHISSKPFVGSSAYNRLKLYLKELNIDDGETPRSFRDGCSITLELLEVPKPAIAKHVQSWTFQMENEDHPFPQIPRGKNGGLQLETYIFPTEQILMRRKLMGSGYGENWPQ